MTNVLSTTFAIPKELHQQFVSLPEWINRQALLRELLGDAEIIKLREFKGKRHYEGTRSEEVVAILKKSLPRILKQCEHIEQVMNSA